MKYLIPIVIAISYRLHSHNKPLLKQSSQRMAGTERLSLKLKFVKYLEEKMLLLLLFR